MLIILYKNKKQEDDEAEIRIISVYYNEICNLHISLYVKMLTVSKSCKTYKYLYAL